MKNTTNYNLKKPEGTDVVNVDDFNANADIIDNKLKELETSEIFYSVATGSANSYAVTIPALSTLSTYFDGLAVCVKINVASTGASTLNINNWGAKSIIDSLGNPINSGGLKAGIPYTLRYNGVNFILQGKGGGGNLTADKLLVGYKGTGDTGEVVGTMPNYADSTISTVGETTIITAIDTFVGNGNSTYGTLTHKLKASGYMNGETIVKQNIMGLNPSSIKAGHPIGNSTLGITGTFTADGTAVGSDMLSGKTAYVNGVKVTGTIPSKATATINPSTTAQTIASGQFISGTQTIAPVTGTANVDHVLAGYGFNSANGINLTGTMPNLTGIRTATGVAKWGDGALAVYPEKGYQKGGSGDGEIKVTTAQLQSVEAGLIPSNVRSGSSVFGVVGTLPVYDSPSLVPGTTVILYKDTVSQSYSYNTYGVVKSATCANQGGTVTVTFSMNGSTTSTYCYGQVWINGIARGIERYTNYNGGTFSENFTVNVGDVVQIYARYAVAASVRIASFQMSCGNNYGTFV